MKLPDLKYIDKTYWVLFITLVIVAVIALFSAGSTLVYEKHSVLGPVFTQMLWLLIGIAIAFFVQFVPSSYIRAFGYPLLLLSIIFGALLVILPPSNPMVVNLNGASRWLKIAGVQFQPSELAKLSLLIVVADLLARIRTEEDKKKYFFWTLGLTAVTCLPIMTGNLSTAVLLAGIVLLMWILARLPWKYIGATVGIAVLLMTSGYLIVEFGFIRKHRSIEGPFARTITQVKRVDAMFAEMFAKEDKGIDNADLDENYQRKIAKVAVARGGKTPFGVFPGNSQERDYLPQAFADYIFAIIVEESGIVGVIFLIFIYLAILFRACLTSSRFGDYAAMLMVMGLALMLTCQALVSMMVAVGLGPVTGQPLPLISRGGTSAIITSVYFGIIMAVSREQKELSDRQQRTTDESLEDVPDITIND
jgi:cell division protein FtsW